MKITRFYPEGTADIEKLVISLPAVYISDLLLAIQILTGRVGEGVYEVVSISDTKICYLRVSGSYFVIGLSVKVFKEPIIFNPPVIVSEESAALVFQIKYQGGVRELAVK